MEQAKLHALHMLDPFDQSARDGDWKIYHIELYQFELPADETPRPIGGLPFAWMTLDQMKSSRPITTTLKYIASKLKGE